MQDLQPIEIPSTYQEIDRIYNATVARNMRSIAFCSANSSEGNSLVLQSFAKRVLSADRSTLVVDLNLHKPTMHTRFAISRGEASNKLLPAPQHIVTAEESQNLSVITANLDKKTLMHLREPGSIEEHIEQWKKDFDVVLIDTAPLNSVNSGNLPAERIAAGVDGTIMTVQSGVTTESALKQAMKRLQETEALVVGSILNDRFDPPLKTEILREIHRIKKRFPKLAKWLSEKVYNSRILNLEP